MSFGQFFWAWLARSFENSWDTAHNVRRVVDLLVAALVLRAVFGAFGTHAAHEGEPAMLVVAPLAAALLILLGSLVWFAYALYREEYDRRVRAERRLVPVLEIRGIEPVRVGDDHRRVIVHNVSDGRVRFRARLVEIRSSPPVRYPLPVPLAPTHGQTPYAEAEVEGGGDQPIDVFVDDGPPHQLGLLFVGNPPVAWQVPRDNRYALRICVYPVADGAVGACRWFDIVPQSDGGVIFTPAGANEAINPAAPAAG
ncbi:MAG TPA: hypothetical protein VFE78_27620 [Gemmataceae bacterium]|jgi:hypothetical protein|nr:hypothetical protein [Gemmataceae bacterium]